MHDLFGQSQELLRQSDELSRQSQRLQARSQEVQTQIQGLQEAIRDDERAIDGLRRRRDHVTGLYSFEKVRLEREIESLQQRINSMFM